jgi:hypothetical protein
MVWVLFAEVVDQLTGKNVPDPHCQRQWHTAFGSGTLPPELAMDGSGVFNPLRGLAACS